ncbi:hypothetical protein GH714_040628 [Hevea brasiliensis]|uniref:Hydrophobic seed protein domain-containing protein n=1 Tax=Hevea brasiliensis TaxID=3981 RepID=A0A6A6L0N0_HEVBR|nr:hypothetical protein GH714_040628 [Hevea brasiliensis]
MLLPLLLLGLLNGTTATAPAPSSPSSSCGASTVNVTGAISLCVLDIISVDVGVGRPSRNCCRGLQVLAQLEAKIGLPTFSQCVNSTLNDLRGILDALGTGLHGAT